MSVMQMNSEVFRSTVAGEAKPVLVEFWAPWCVYCRRIGSAMEKLAEQYGESVRIGQVNIDEAPEAAEQYRVDVVPTLLLFRDGQVRGTLVAPDSKAKIESFLQEHLAK